MGQARQERARAYSDAKVARARSFLARPQDEAESFRDRLAAARYTCGERKRWLQDVEADERQASQ